MCAWAVLSLVSALWAGCQQSAAGSSTPDSSPGAPTAGRSFYVVPSGDDSAAGTQKLPWRTVARASAELAPGDTLFLGGGVYRERGIVMTRAGTANAPITIRSVATELPVIDGGFAEFRDAGNSDWEICDPARGIYRSKKPFSAVERAYGYLGPTDGGYPLVPYESYAALSSVIEDYSETVPYYVGPGVFWNDADQRIYARLVHGRYQARLGYEVPASMDPGLVPMVLFPRRTVLVLSAPTSHLVIEGIALRYGEIAVDVESGCHHLTMRRCDLLGGRYAVVTRNAVHHLVFDTLTVDGHFPPWVARSDVKRPSAGAPAHLLQGSALQLENQLDSVEVTNCVFSGLFDAIDTNGAATRLAIHHNQFRTIRDDAIEVATAAHAVDFHHNSICFAAAGVSRTGSVAPPPGAAGTKYIHHNVIDTSTAQLYGRDDPKHLLPATWRGPRGDGMATGRPFGSHDTASLDGPDPWKIYHNTIVGGADVDGGGFGICYRFRCFDRACPQEVYNNILVQTGDQWVTEGARVADGSQVFDGNLYYRSFAQPTTPLLKDCQDAHASADYFRLADFMTSSAWRATGGHGRSGWEMSGREANPALDPGYRAAADGPAASGAVDISAKDWPDATRLVYRGAVSPH